MLRTLGGRGSIGGEALTRLIPLRQMSDFQLTHRVRATASWVLGVGQGYSSHTGIKHRKSLKYSSHAPHNQSYISLQSMYFLISSYCTGTGCFQWQISVYHRETWNPHWDFLRPDVHCSEELPLIICNHNNPSHLMYCVASVWYITWSLWYILYYI